MSVDNDGLAILAEFLPHDVLAGGAHGNAGEHARAAALTALGFDVWRHISIVQRGRVRVNGGKRGRVQKTQFAISLLNLSKVPRMACLFLRWRENGITAF